MKHIEVVLSMLLLSGCATTSFDTKVGQRIYNLVPEKQNGKGTCRIQTKLYAWFIGGEAMSNGKHAFVVKNGKMYDSTRMIYTTLSVDSEEVIEHYGHKSTWKKLR